MEFYTDLGFRIVFQGEEFPGFIALESGGVEFGLQEDGSFEPAHIPSVLVWQFQAQSLRPVIQLAEFRVNTIVRLRVMSLGTSNDTDFSINASWSEPPSGMITSLESVVLPTVEPAPRLALTPLNLSLARL